MAKSGGSYKPGQSGNPKGRPPKGYSITDAFKSMFKESPEKKQEIVDSIFAKAKRGDPTAQKLVWSYMDGMPQQNVDWQGELKVTPILGAISVPSNDSDQEVIEAEIQD